MVGLVQINNCFSGQNYLPYSVALLQTYVQKMPADPGRYTFLPPIYKRVRIADAVEAMKDADIVGFSTYVWNGRISLEIARRLKARKPGIVIVFGGPHVPDQPEEFLRANPQIDLAVHNEGERTFLNSSKRSRTAILAVAAGRQLRQAGRQLRAQPQHRSRARPRRDPVAVPRRRVRRDHGGQSPGELDRPVGNQSRLPVPLHVLRLGLGDGGQGHQVRRGAPLREVDWFADKKIEYIFCCDANFGIQKRDVDIAKYVAGIKQAPAIRSRFRCRTPRTPPSAPTRPRRSCPTPV